MSRPEKQAKKQAVKREKRAFQKAIQMELREHKSSSWSSPCSASL